MAKKKRIKKSAGKGIKFDDMKPYMALMVPEAEVEEAKAMSHGADKYGPYNFTRGLTVTRIMSSLKRHTNAFMRGEDYDPDSGKWHCHHLGNIRACAGMVLHILKYMPELDDRWRPKKKTRNK